MARIYLYGIIDSVEEAAFGIPGVDGASPVHAVVRQGLACVVSEYRGEEFGNLSKEGLVRRLLVHQQVVERVMRQYTVLPVKFGTLLENPQEALDLLAQGRSQFMGALAASADKVEIEVAATWDTSRVLHEMSNEADVVRVREAINHKGQPTIEDRVRLGQVVKECMDRRRGSYQERMVSFLKTLSVDDAPNALLSEDMVMNVAFLVERARQREFDTAVEQLDKLFENEITFRVIGPLPPYSFSTVEVSRLTPEQVEEARQTLRLEEVVSEAQVRRAYRRLAAEEQRSLSSGDRGANERFARLKQASELMLRYWQARNQAQNGGHFESAYPNSGGAFIISIKGSRSDEVESARFGGAT